MHQFTLNIGLNINNTENPNQLKSTIHYLDKFFKDNYKYIVVESGVNSSWGNERVVVVTGVSRLMFSQFIANIELMCVFLGQDAIAYKYLNINELCFCPFYEGERYKFSSEFFIGSE